MMLGDMQIFVTRDLADLAAHVREFLTGRPIEHNVMATVVDTLEPSGCTDPPLLAWVQAGASGKITGVVLRTPPRFLLTSDLSEEGAGALMPRLLEIDPELPGVSGPQPAASHLAAAWRQCTGGTVAPGMRQAIYWLAQVTEAPGRPAGFARVGNRSDRDLVIEWTSAFCRDAGVPAIGGQSGVDRRLRDGQMLLWEDERVVSMAGSRPPVAGVVRLGPVYTPPEARCRGYATALVADVSRRALAAGATKCMLYTDLANETSNKIYQAVGYRRSHDAQEYVFRSAGRSG